MKLIQDYLADTDKYPLFLNGDSLEILKSFPDESLDCCITSPPYWRIAFFVTTPNEPLLHFINLPTLCN